MRTSVQETSINAYHQHKNEGRCVYQRERIIDLIRAHGGDWSIGEIAKIMGLEKSTVSARVNELLNVTKQLSEKPKRKDRVSGVTVRPVGLPEEWPDLFGGEH